MLLFDLRLIAKPLPIPEVTLDKDKTFSVSYKFKPVDTFNIKSKKKRKAILQKNAQVVADKECAKTVTIKKIEAKSRKLIVTKGKQAEYKNDGARFMSYNKSKSPDKKKIVYNVGFKCYSEKAETTQSAWNNYAKEIDKKVNNESVKAAHWACEKQYGFFDCVSVTSLRCRKTFTKKLRKGTNFKEYCKQNSDYLCETILNTVSLLQSQFNRVVACSLARKALIIK